MKKHILTSLAAAALLSLTATASLAQNIAIVNGKPIPSARADAFMKQLARQGQAVTPEIEKQVKEHLIQREIFAQEAAARGLDASDEFKQRMQEARETALIQQLMADFDAKTPIGDEEARTEYNRLVAANAGKEYQARHILVDTEAEALKILSQLQKGAKFETLASKSKDPSSAKKGGLLDWAGPGSLVKEFNDAMVALKKGEMTAKPVKTQYGFHIIRLEGVRDTQFPKFEEVKGQLIPHLKKQKWAKFQEELTRKAKVE